MTYPLPGDPVPPSSTPGPHPTVVDLLHGDIAAAREVFDRLQAPARAVVARSFRRQDMDGQWRPWKHDPLCLTCDGTGTARMFGYDTACSCGSWANEIPARHDPEPVPPRPRPSPGAGG